MSDSGRTSTMSATTAVAAAGKITKHKRDVENEEIRAYLCKLKELVPFMPKNRRLSKLEVIQYVIDYICDLQQALEAHPTISSVAVHSAAAAAVMLSSASQAAGVNLQMLGIANAAECRQPLSILPANSNSNLTNANVSSINTTSTCSVSQASSISTTTSSSNSGASRQNEKVAY